MLERRNIVLHRHARGTTGEAKVSSRIHIAGFVISSGFAWVMASLPTTAHAKRGGTIPISDAPVCTVVVQATKRGFETPGVTGAGLVQGLLFCQSEQSPD